MGQTMEFQHRNFKLTFSNCTLLDEESIDYGGPRGFKVRIFIGQSVTSGRLLYIVQKIGLSSVEGENDICTVRTARTPSALIKALHSPAKPQKDGTRHLYLPRASRIVLTRLAANHEGIKTAWEHFAL